MKKDVLINLPISKEKLESDLTTANNKTKEYGLVLSYEQMMRINNHRIKVLGELRRVEFGEGVIIKLIDTFCDSPYIDQENYEEMICNLQETFYYFKNESMERLSDDQLIKYMKDKFDNVCHGSVDYLASTILENFCRELREYE